MAERNNFPQQTGPNNSVGTPTWSPRESQKKHSQGNKMTEKMSQQGGSPKSLSLAVFNCTRRCRHMKNTSQE